MPKRLNNYIPFLLAGFIALFFANCGSETSQDNNSKKLKVVSTTTLATDLLRQIGGDAINVEGLMGAGIDPHLYKASEGDMRKLSEADLVVYNGLHLEGKLEDILEKMSQRGVKVIALGELLDKKELIRSENFASNYDPHIWFDLTLWQKVASTLAEKLKELSPNEQEVITKNLETYLTNIKNSQAKIDKMVSQIPEKQRVLITAHDAFSYFGRAYNFEVRGLQGISTTAEAGVKDVQSLASYIAKNEIKAIFVESSVPKRNIEALQAAVKSKGFEVTIGGELFSDACGNPDTPEETLLGMLTYNVNTIISALK